MKRLSKYREPCIGYQIQHAKKIKDLAGSGIVDYFQEKGEQLLNITLRGRPKILNDLVELEGEQIVSAVKVCRKPVSKTFQYILNLITFGEMKKEMNRLGYDNLFHLYIIVYLQNGTTYSLEKNERVNVISGEVEGGECMPIYQFGRDTLKQFVENSENQNIENFYQYDAFTNNCQTWVYTILNANGITEFNSFIEQDVKDITPEYIKKIAKLITNVVGITDYVMRGGGDDEDDLYN